MTLEEKAALCTGTGPWATTPIPRLGLPPLVVSDGPHRLRHPKDINDIGTESHPATCFPTASSLACTWNPEPLEAMGQAGGAAIADVLFGAVNPSGKLAENFPLQVEDTPAHLNWPGENNQVRYGENLFIGYRYYDAKRIPVLFPFGYGLSYTSFAYSNPRISTATFKDVDGLTVTVDVTNTGAVAGKETVQVYIHDCKSGLVRPEKELKGFAKVELQPGETKTVQIHLDFRSFAFYHPAYKQWITEDGEFEILIGASAADIRFRESVTLESTLELPCILKYDSTIKEWLDDPRGKPVLQPLLDQMMRQMGGMLGGDEADTGIGMDMLTFMLDMPLPGILEFQDTTLPAPVDTIVNDLLAKAHGQS
jgi:beta-glucosidase